MRPTRPSWPQPDRPRFVAGSLGPTNRTASMSADVGDPAARSVTWDELEVAYREVGRRPDRGRRRHPPHRDDLRHAQREGGDRRGPVALRRARRAAAAHHLGDHRRRVRPNAVGPDRRGLLAQHPSRRSAHRRAQLRARAEAAARAPRRPVARRGPAGLGLPERRPAERARWLRRDARGDGRGARRVGAARPAQRRRQLLRLDAGPRRRDRRGRRRPAAAPDPGADRRRPACRASSRSSSRRPATPSSTSASGRT